MTAIVIDTDPGIDDAIALLYALRHPDLSVIALTTVAGNIGLPVTTDNAGRLAALAGRALPVHSGAAAPMARAAEPELAIHGSDGLGGVFLPEARIGPSRHGAVTALSDLLMQAPPGTIELHCLAPLTNIAELLLRTPQVAARIKRLIVMGGAVATHGNFGPEGRAEFNLGQDPDAAAIVLHAGLDLTLIPLDATRQFRADAAYVQALRDAGSTAATTCADLIDAYFGANSDRESRPLHDPCVPLLALHPELFHMETRMLEVEQGTGALIPGPYPIHVAMGLNAPALRARLLAGLAEAEASAAC
ncbi:MAG: nucleoside hydrolase [Celeribacter sp.]|jgi:purine nucleosidase/pyrimidine-specific ribonucleoside hydrolase